MSVWIPLRRSEVLGGEGSGYRVGDWEELDCVGTAAIAADHRELGERLGWSDIGLIHTAAPFASRELPYKPADVYWHNDGEPVGAELVLVQRLNSDHEREWLISQDLVMALGLLREGDRWLRVDEGYVEVLRQRRDASGKVVSIEIKSEFLRDYLAARGMALRIAQYRRRMAILKDASYLAWATEAVEVKDEGGRFSRRVFGIDADGGVAGGGVAVMHVWRTDVDHQEDVPVFGQENDQNTAYRSFSYERPGPLAYRAEGELWREEWIEPAVQSVRVRGDDSTEQLHYIVDASGETLPASDLDNEDVGRWLWFRPQVIQALLAFRGSALDWYTRQTGSVKCSPDYGTHFGVNSGGSINVYAYDIAKLPQWQQRVWAGHNAAPDGPVAAELLSAQMGHGPTDTRAPERELVKWLELLDEFFQARYGNPLFRGHSERLPLLASVHRFRALTAGGVLSLAKDIARITADSIDIPLLREIVKPPSDQKLGSLKLLQAAMANSIGADAARAIMGPLVGIYDMRLGDAHLPSSSIGEAFELVGIEDVSISPVDQALQLLDSACSTLEKIYGVFSAA
jgi:hypothetical protein